MEIADIFPIYKVEHGLILSRQGDVTVGFQCLLPEIFTLSGRDYEAYHQTWVRAIRCLLPGTLLHKQDYFTRTIYKGKFDESKDFLGLAGERFFNEREYLEHSCHLYLTLSPVGRKASSSGYCNILRKGVIPTPLVNPAFCQKLEDASAQFIQIMRDSGFVTFSRLSDDELAGTDKKAGVIEDYMFLGGGLTDVIVRDGLQVGSKKLRVFSLSDPGDLPGVAGSRINYEPYSTDKSKFSVGFASPLGQLLPCNHILNQYIRIADAPELVKRLEARKLRLHSLSAYSRENAVSRDAVNEYLNETVSSQRLAVHAHFNVICWAETDREFQNIKQLAASSFSKLDAQCKEETIAAPQIWFAGIPGNAADLPENDTFLSFAEQAACFFNLESHERSSLSPFGIRLGDRLSGVPLNVDISDEPMQRGWITNRNKMILGPSGSGKSFFTNHLLRSYYEQGAHIVLVDVGHSYKGLCDLVNGYYFTYSEARPIQFNPFYLPAGETLDTEKKESLKTLLVALWKKDDEAFRRSEYVGLSNALAQYYALLADRSDIFPCFDTFYEFLQTAYLPTLRANGVREQDFDGAGFLYTLAPYYRGGEFDYLLNARDNLDLLHERLIVFEIDAVKDHPILFPAITLIIMEVFISKMRRLTGIRKVILLEEAWKAIAREGMAEYIKYLFKTVRKFFGEAIVVTQEVEDILHSPIVKQAIVNNADCKILLDQSKYQNRFEDIQALLGLTEKERAMVLSMNRANQPGRRYKEVFISLGGQYSKVYRTEVSPAEYYAYTTEQREKLEVEQYAAKYGSVAAGISALVADKQSSIA